MRSDRGIPVLISEEEEELCFHPSLEHVSHRFRFGDHLLERETGATLKRSLIRHVNIANQSRNFAPRILPGEYSEGVKVGPQEHVRLFDPDETFDGTSTFLFAPRKSENCSRMNLTFSFLHLSIISFLSMIPPKKV
jgi:hypothetical protein